MSAINKEVVRTVGISAAVTVVTNLVTYGVFRGIKFFYNRKKGETQETPAGDRQEAKSA